VLGDSKKYYKINNIFVVDNPKVLKLKYLLHLKKNVNQNLGKLTAAIDCKFGKMLVKEKQAQSNYMSTVRNKRLLKEVEYVMSGKTEQFGLSFDVPEDNFHIWYASVTNIDQDSLLYKDMQTLGISEIKMEIRFEPQYPIKPPFVRIVEPIFLYRTGNITLGGSICMELLTNQGWSPACSIESLLIQIKANILETGQLDHTKIGRKYSYQESQVAFKRMLLSHGWV
jgi:ubiquitin-conjugating enzyme E2 Q